ncbi:hypothetical protein ACQCSU_07190 [Pseudarthrobacter sp. O4]|uniref:hypothetical protein n=1 Tax=Pseudarthrobacter sp. O4 TaxID=3418417 RepID=UPI003CEFB46E
MGKLGGLVLVALLGITGCSAPAATERAATETATTEPATSETAPAETASAEASEPIGPLLAEPAPAASESSSAETVSAEASEPIGPLLVAPSPAASVAPEFNDESAQRKYLEGVKKVWRGDIPSDEVLLEDGGASCTLFAEGKNRSEIGTTAGPGLVDIDNATAAATYASRNLCTQFNTDR